MKSPRQSGKLTCLGDETGGYMELQTVVRLDKPSFQIDYSTRLMMLGSCFVENVGAKLEYFRFKTDINPCGIVYNPLSVAGTLELLLSGRRFTQADLLQNGEQWVSLSHHGRFSARDAGECLQRINSRLEESAAHLERADVLVITWGTAWVYRHRQSGQVVANCHKFPAADFERFRLSLEDIEQAYTGLLSRLHSRYPGIKVLFTVSPIRHWKDGAHANQLSKAVLLLAADSLVQGLDYVSYFPSYEIVMDELRDYRFYAEDMLHVSPQGIEYIWEKFHTLYMTPETRAWMKRVDKINRMSLHRPSEPDSPAYRELVEKTAQERERLERELRIVFG